MNSKLTNKQRETLAFINAGRVTNHKFGYAAWRICGPAHPTVVGRVMAMGLAEWGAAADNQQVAQLTEAGKLVNEQTQ